MNCAEVNQKMELFVLGEVPKSEQAAIKAHLAVCPACNSAQAEYRLLVTEIKRDAQPYSLRLDFVRAVRSAAKTEIRSIALRSFARRIVTITGSATACLLFALVIWHIAAKIRNSEFGIRNSRQSRAPSILQAWQHRGARSVPGSMADEVVVRGQNVYVLQEYGGQAYVSALDVRTGRQKWLSDIQSCGYLLADDARVYCLSQNEAAKFDMVALDAANGKTLWKYPHQSPDPLRSPSRATLLPTGRICWTTNATVHVLSCANGEPSWTHTIADDSLLSAAVVMDNNLYVTNSIKLYCLNIETGELSWSLAYGGAISGQDLPLLHEEGGSIYASLSLGFGSRLFCIALKEHKILWSKVVGHVTDLQVIGDMLYVRDQDVQALDRTTGQLLWTYSATGCNPLTYAEGLAYFVDSSDQGRLVALNRYTGCKVWELVGMRSCNAFVKVDSTGFLKTHDGVVYAITFKG